MIEIGCGESSWKIMLKQNNSKLYGKNCRQISTEDIDTYNYQKENHDC
ncbi:unnamed protein product [marine sediment metagenome]|uniref:Uncharacterized protein n=1 Tax=marine sediment metagenome TaxID=412755 RepID=X0XMQ0_9ZZZZ